MSYEIRILIYGVQGMFEVFISFLLNFIQLEYVIIVMKSVDLLFNIVNDILDFFKIDFGNMLFEELFINFVDIIEE